MKTDQLSVTDVNIILRT